ncbi:hypothetical protein BC830DRAFT_291912 [Chytriomyces sp. MP71]|nr:hypothetical protein BC830DRAFT_291912 [Chytriomyces sp. MP71]
MADPSGSSSSSRKPDDGATLGVSCDTGSGSGIVRASSLSLSDKVVKTQRSERRLSPLNPNSAVPSSALSPGPSPLALTPSSAPPATNNTLASPVVASHTQPQPTTATTTGSTSPSSSSSASNSAQGASSGSAPQTTLLVSPTRNASEVADSAREAEQEREGRGSERDADGDAGRGRDRDSREASASRPGRRNLSLVNASLRRLSRSYAATGSTGSGSGSSAEEAFSDSDSAHGSLRSAARNHSDSANPLAAPLPVTPTSLASAALIGTVSPAASYAAAATSLMSPTLLPSVLASSNSSSTLKIVRQVRESAPLAASPLSHMVQDTATYKSELKSHAPRNYPPEQSAKPNHLSAYEYIFPPPPPPNMIRQNTTVGLGIISPSSTTSTTSRIGDALGTLSSFLEDPKPLIPKQILFLSTSVPDLPKWVHSGATRSTGSTLPRKASGTSAVSSPLAATSVALSSGTGKKVTVPMPPLRHQNSSGFEVSNTSAFVERRTSQEDKIKDPRSRTVSLNSEVKPLRVPSTPIGANVRPSLPFSVQDMDLFTSIVEKSRQAKNFSWKKDDPVTFFVNWQEEVRGPHHQSRQRPSRTLSNPDSPLMTPSSFPAAAPPPPHGGSQTPLNDLRSPSPIFSSDDIYDDDDDAASIASSSTTASSMRASFRSGYSSSTNRYESPYPPPPAGSATSHITSRTHRLRTMQVSTGSTSTGLLAGLGSPPQLQQSALGTPLVPLDAGTPPPPAGRYGAATVLNANLSSSGFVNRSLSDGDLSEYLKDFADFHASLGMAKDRCDLEIRRIIDELNYQVEVGLQPYSQDAGGGAPAGGSPVVVPGDFGASPVRAGRATVAGMPPSLSGATPTPTPPSLSRSQSFSKKFVQQGKQKSSLNLGVAGPGEGELERTMVSSPSISQSSGAAAQRPHYEGSAPNLSVSPLPSHSLQQRTSSGFLAGMSEISRPGSANNSPRISSSSLVRTSGAAFNTSNQQTGQSLPASSISLASTTENSVPTSLQRTLTDLISIATEILDMDIDSLMDGHSCRETMRRLVVLQERSWRKSAHSEPGSTANTHLMRMLIVFAAVARMVEHLDEDVKLWGYMSGKRSGFLPTATASSSRAGERGVYGPQSTPGGGVSVATTPGASSIPGAAAMRSFSNSPSASLFGRLDADIVAAELSDLDGNESETFSVADATELILARRRSSATPSSLGDHRERRVGAAASGTGVGAGAGSHRSFGGSHRSQRGSFSRAGVQVFNVPSEPGQQHQRQPLQQTDKPPMRRAKSAAFNALLDARGVDPAVLDLRYAALETQAKNIFMEMTLEGAISYVSPAVEDVLGYTPQELIARSGAAVAALLESRRGDNRASLLMAPLYLAPGGVDASVFKDATVHLMSDQSITTEVTYRAHTKDGRWMEMEGKGMLMYDRVSGEMKSTVWLVKPVRLIGEAWNYIFDDDNDMYDPEAEEDKEEEDEEESSSDYDDDEYVEAGESMELICSKIRLHLPLLEAAGLPVKVEEASRLILFSAASANDRFQLSTLKRTTVLAFLYTS